MREQDIMKIGKRMANTPPPEGFFESFTDSTLREIERRESRAKSIRRGIKRLLFSTASAAAMLGVVMWSNWDSVTGIETNGQLVESCYIEGHFERELTSYVENLSVDDIESLLHATETDDLFYSNL